MQSAIVVLVISFIWFYIGVFPFKYYIHESFHSHSCMNSCYSFMCYVMVLWLLLSLDIQMKRYNPIMVLSLCYSYDSTLWKSIGISFSWYSFYSFIGWVFNIFFLLYRGEPEKNVYQKEKLEHLKATKFHLAYYTQQPTNETQPF